MTSPLTLAFFQLACCFKGNYALLLSGFSFCSSSESVFILISSFRRSKLHANVLLFECLLFALVMIKGCLTSQFVLLTVHKNCIQVTLLFVPIPSFLRIIQDLGDIFQQAMLLVSASSVPRDDEMMLPRCHAHEA